MAKLKSKTVHFSQENIDRLLKSENEFQTLKTDRADDYTSMQEKKLDQYATCISHTKPIYDADKTDSDNLPRQVGIDIRTDLQNNVGMSVANSKVLYEKSVQFVAKFNDDIPTQATPEAVLEVFASMNIVSQNDIKKAVSKEKDVDLADKIGRQLFGKTKVQKTKLEDGTVKEEEVYIPTNLDADQVQKVWEVLQDKKREREEHDKASAKAQKKTSEDNDVISRMENALAS